MESCSRVSGVIGFRAVELWKGAVNFGLGNEEPLRGNGKGGEGRSGIYSSSGPRAPISHSHTKNDGHNNEIGTALLKECEINPFRLPSFSLSSSPDSSPAQMSVLRAASRPWSHASKIAPAPVPPLSRVCPARTGPVFAQSSTQRVPKPSKAVPAVSPPFPRSVSTLPGSPSSATSAPPAKPPARTSSIRPSGK
jgi:hypothetical protein